MIITATESILLLSFWNIILVTSHIVFKNLDLVDLLCKTANQRQAPEAKTPHDANGVLILKYKSGDHAA